MSGGKGYLMRKNRIKRVLLQMTLILAAAASLYGCSRDGKVISDPEGAAAGTQKNQALGRYAESEVPLPEGVTYDSGLGF